MSIGTNFLGAHELAGEKVRETKGYRFNNKVVYNKRTGEVEAKVQVRSDFDGLFDQGIEVPMTKRECQQIHDKFRKEEPETRRSKYNTKQMLDAMTAITEFKLQNGQVFKSANTRLAGESCNKTLWPCNVGIG